MTTIITIVFILWTIFNPSWPMAKVQKGVLSSVTQPSPQIVSPQNYEQLSGTEQIMIYMDPIGTIEMDVYALNSQNGQRIFLGVAPQQSGTYFYLSWNTTTVANSSYKIWAEAHLSSGIVTYSEKVSTFVHNETITSPNSTTTNVPTPTPAPTAVSTPQPEETATTTEENIPQTEEVTTSSEETGAPRITPAPTPTLPKTDLPTTTPPPETPQKDLITGSQVIATLSFTLDQDKPNRLEKIESRISSKQQKFLLFSGKAEKESPLTLSIYSSQPLVMTTKADKNGNWTYTLEKPLEPGSHQVFVEVQTSTDDTVRSGPYTFAVARAQRTTENPSGASLELIDPAKVAMTNYLYATSGIVGLAILAVVVIFAIKRRKAKMEVLNIQKPPIKAKPNR